MRRQNNKNSKYEYRSSKQTLSTKFEILNRLEFMILNLEIIWSLDIRI